MPPRALASVCVLLSLAGVAHAARPALPALADSARRYGLDLLVGPAKHPGQVAVVLVDRKEIMVDYSSNQTIKIHRILKVLRGNAVEGSTVRIVAATDADVQIAARTISPSGEAIFVAASDIHRQRMGTRDPLTTRPAEVTSFALPAIEEGAFLELMYTMQVGEELTADAHVLDGPYPIQVAQYVVSYPADVSFEFFAEAAVAAHIPRRTTSMGTTSDGRSLPLQTFECRDLPALPREWGARVDTHDRPHVLVTAGDPELLWANLATALMRSQEGPRVGLEIQRAAVLKLTQRYESAEDRATAITQYFASRMRIETAAQVSDRFRTPDEVMKSGVATPMEWSRLLVTLLRTAGLRAYLGLVNTTASALEFDRRVPWIGFFDRHVVLVQGDTRELYFDPQSPEPASGRPRADLPSRPMFVAKWTPGSEGARPWFAEVPAIIAAEHGRSRRATIDLAAGGAATIELVDQLRGEAAWRCQDAVRALGTAEAERALLDDAHFDLRPTRIASAEASCGSGGAIVRARLTTDTVAVRGPDGVVLSLTALARPSILDRLWSPPAAQRTAAIDLDFARRDVLEVRVRLPNGARATKLPATVRSAGPGLHFELSFKPLGDGFSMEEVIEIQRSAIGREALAELGRWLTDVARARAAGIHIAGLESGDPLDSMPAADEAKER